MNFTAVYRISLELTDCGKGKTLVGKGVFGC